MMNKQITALIPALLAAMLFLTCKNSTEPETTPDPGKQILKNSNVEEGTDSPEHWRSWFSTGAHGNPTPNRYEIVRSNEHSFSGSYSLKISPISINDENAFAYWAQTIDSDIPVGKSLTLTAMIRLENVVGEGVALAIRGDNAPTPSDSSEVLSTTEGKRVISGTSDFWTSYSVSLSTVPAGIKSIVVYLLFLPRTTGTVYFDDITLYAK